MTRLHQRILTSLAVACAPLAAASADEVPAKPSLQEALKRLELPGVTINVEERCVDVESMVCLDEGLLELIACTKDSKEHESIIAIEALPKHVHTALLLLGAKPGSPAMRKVTNEEGTRWVDIPPHGGPVDVSLAFKDKEGKLVERPISDFISRATDQLDGFGEPAKDEGKAPEKFPTHTFLFAGSHLVGDGPGPRQYLSDLSGNVISISTFGDELLCLPDVHSHAKGSLMWQVEPEGLPAVGTKITLRLRPQLKAKPAPAKEPATGE